MASLVQKSYYWVHREGQSLFSVPINTIQALQLSLAVTIYHVYKVHWWQWEAICAIQDKRFV